MNLDELTSKLPEKFRPLAAEYGPAFLKMGEQAILSWINLLATGQTDAAWKQVLANLPNQDLLTQYTTLAADWQAANEANADRMSLQRAAATALLRVLLTVALAAAGF